MNATLTSTKQGVLIFDLDGTLINTSEDIAHSINYVRKSEGFEPLTTPEVLRSVGKGAPYLVRNTLHLSQDDTEKEQELLLRFQEHYMAHQGERSAPYPGIVSALEKLTSRYDLYVLSNKPDPATKLEIEKQGLSVFFKDVWGAGVFDALKPNPIGILTAIQRSNSTAERTIMIGDLNVDIQTGINGMVRTVHVTWGFGSIATNDPKPTVFVSNGQELVEKVILLLP